MSLLICLVMALSMIMPAQVQDRSIVVSSPDGGAAELAQGRRWALLVGIADYPSVQGFEVQKLKAPVKDVEALAEFLKDTEKSGFEPDYIITLTDEEATQRNILLEFNKIASRAAPEDMVLFYFSGHGVPSGETETTYLVPYDHDLRYMETTCIDFNDLQRIIQKMDASKVVFILDACHSGGIKMEGSRGVDSKCLVERYVKSFRESEGRALLLSSDESEVSWETDEFGVFTHFLMEGMAGKADADRDGIVTFTEVSGYVENQVPSYTREHFPRVQQPMRRYEGKVRGDIPLAINWGVVEQHRQQKLVDSQQELLNGRNAVIFQAALVGLDDALKEFSLSTAKSAYLNAVDGEPLKEHESLLLKEIDALRDGKIDTEDYILRARAIHHNLLKVTPAPIRGESVPLEPLVGALKLDVEPVDARIILIPVDTAAPDAGMKTSRGITVRPGDYRKLPVGVYRVLAEKEGYESIVQEAVEIKANIEITVTIKLKPAPPEPATISASGLPGDVKVMVDGNPVTLPHQLTPGTYSIRMERKGFHPVEMSRMLSPGEKLTLEAEWRAIELPKAPGPAGVFDTRSSAMSLVIPGLGQHVKRQHVRGAVYEAVVVVSGIMAIRATHNYQNKLDSYVSLRNRLENYTGSVDDPDTLAGIARMTEQQDDAHRRAKSARALAIATRVVLGVAWGTNALDAGIVKPASRSVAFEAFPVRDGMGLMVCAPF